jgi:hypothetical protein
MLKKLTHKKRLRPVYLTGDEIPDEIETLIEKNEILSLSGVLGSKKGGTPVEYEEIKIKANGKWFVLEVYNRGLSMVYFETPELKRVFPLCSKLREKVRK